MDHTVTKSNIPWLNWSRSTPPIGKTKLWWQDDGALTSKVSKQAHTRTGMWLTLEACHQDSCDCGAALEEQWGSSGRIGGDWVPASCYPFVDVVSAILTRVSWIAAERWLRLEWLGQPFSTCFLQRFEHIQNPLRQRTRIYGHFGHLQIRQSSPAQY